MTTAPAYSEKEHRVGLVGLPFWALFDWPMGTPSGFAVFQDPHVNAILKRILNEWGRFLQSEKSASVLGTQPHGWFGPTGKRDLEMAANEAAGTSLKFEEIFECDPRAKYHGFKSWDDFFTRKFRDGVRPVAAPNRDDVIINACEATPYKVGYHVEARQRFWLKGQPYSVVDMLAHDKLSEQFIGGTVYQAFLSALSYHRWHSPVRGQVVKAYVVDGTYYSEPPYTGLEESQEINPEGENYGQEYLSALATRALIFIEADNPDIGLICVMPIGMVEVSSCDITVKEGQRVEKGDEIGMVRPLVDRCCGESTNYPPKFHFGGSTHCVLFRKGLNVKGFPEPGRQSDVPVKSELAHVEKG